MSTITSRTANSLTAGIARVSVSVILISMFAIACFGQSMRSYVIASPNTRSKLTDQDARMSLGSFEHVNATAVADRLACSLTHSVRIADGVGIFDDSSENSFVVQTDLGQKQTEYLSFLLARYSHQEFVLLFITRPTGADRLWIIRTPQSWNDVANQVRSLHLVPVTVTEKQNTIDIYVVDFGSKSTAKLATLVSLLKATSETTIGSAEIPGDEDRKTATTLFEQEIKSAEQQNGKHLSTYLWTPAGMTLPRGPAAKNYLLRTDNRRGIRGARNCRVGRLLVRTRNR